MGLCKSDKLATRQEVHAKMDGQTWVQEHRPVEGKEKVLMHRTCALLRSPVRIGL